MDSLVTEFDLLAWKATHRYVKWAQRADPSLTLDDVRQLALEGLWRRRDRFEGVTDRNERGLIAWNACGDGISRHVHRFDWQMRDPTKFDVLPIIETDDSNTLDWLGFAHTDHTDSVDLIETLRTELDERAFRMVLRRAHGETFAEIAEAEGYASGASACSALRSRLSNSVLGLGLALD